MGLDICAYSKLVEAPDARRDQDGELEDWEHYRQFRESDDFPGRLEGLKPDVAYQVGGETFEFRAGSYTGYCAWRNQLAQMAGYPLTRYEGPDGETEGYDAGAWFSSEGPFFEQINFTDSDGTLGPSASARLAADYAAHADKAEQIGSVFWALYQQWQQAFSLAKDDGAVVFG